MDSERPAAGLDRRALIGTALAGVGAIAATTGALGERATDAMDASAPPAGGEVVYVERYGLHDERHMMFLGSPLLG